MLVLEKLKEGKEFTGTDLSLAKFILQDPESVIHMSLSELSQNAYCSEAAIIRLCKKIGCAGFPELKVKLAQESNIYLETFDKPLDAPFDENATPEEIVHSLSVISRKAIKDVEESIDLAQLQKVADMIMSAEHVHFFGQDQSIVIAHDLRYKLLRIGISADCDSVQGFSNLYARNLGEKDVAFVISHYVSTYNVLRWMDLLQGRNVPIVLLTCIKDPQFIKKNKDIVITVPNAETNRNIGSFAGRNGMIYICDCIFSLIFAKNYEKNKNHLEERIDRFTEANHKIAKLIR